jgi:GcrA cell cycle regulator
MSWWTLELDIAVRDGIVARKAWPDIAASLHMTRDQVARRASRLGLKRGMSFQDAARRVRVWDDRRKDGSAHPQRRETKKPAVRKPRAPPWLFRVERAEIREIPRSKHNVTFLELGPHHCRYPIGDPKTTDFRFCGALRLDDKPYCARCLEIASIPKGRKLYGWRAESAAKLRRELAEVARNV